jgi:hypothetical protein
VINKKMENDRAGSQIAAFHASGPGDLEVLGEFKSEPIVNPVEIGAHYSWSADTGAHPAPADNDPTVDWGDKESLVELATDRSL